MRVILIAAAREECGKTTLATTLASALAASGRRVAIADADPMRPSLDWLSRRPAEAPPILGYDYALEQPRPSGGRPTPGATLKREVWRGLRAAAQRSRVEWLIIHAPAANAAPASELRNLVAKADIVVAPIAPTVCREAVARNFLSLLENSAAIRRGEAELLVAASRIRRKRRPESRLADAVDRYFSRLGFDPATEIREGAAYSMLAAEGLAVFDPQAESLGPRSAARLRAEWAPLLLAIAPESEVDGA